MSIPEQQKEIKILANHEFAYNIGDTVYLKTDKKFKYPMLIVAFLLDEYNCNDYRCKWFNSQGSTEEEGWPEECLIQKNQ